MFFINGTFLHIYQHSKFPYLYGISHTHCSRERPTDLAVAFDPLRWFSVIIRNDLNLTQLNAIIFFSKDKKNLKDPGVVKANLIQEYENMGSLSFHEISVALLFIIAVLLWFFRDPGFLPGWQNLFDSYKYNFFKFLFDHNIFF